MSEDDGDGVRVRFIATEPYDGGPVELTATPWPSGPWDDEPDELDFAFGDVRCRIVRHPRLGMLNGYVAIPPSHPWYGKSYDDLDPDEGDGVEVHGGLTFAGTFDEATYATADGQPLWWVGFDTGHAGDYQPGMTDLGIPNPWPGEYRTLNYVRGECEHLARQAIRAMR